MDLETTAPTTQKTSSANISSIRPFFERTPQEESNRKSKTFEIPVTTLYSTKEGLRHREVDSRPVTDQRVHKLPIIQDVNHQGGSPSTPNGFLDYIHGFPGRLLACTNSPNQETISRFPLQGSGLAISSNAIRTEHSPESLHETRGSCGSRNGPGGHMVPTLLGRSPNNCSNERKMPSTYTAGPSDSTKIGLHDQQQEIPPSPCTSVHLVRDRLGSDIPYGSSYTGKNAISSNIPVINTSLPYMHQKSSDATTRISKLHRTVRPSRPCAPGRNKDYLTALQTTVPRCPYTDPILLASKTLQMEEHSNNSATLGVTSALADHSNGCFSSGLGVSNKPSSLSRKVRQVNEVFNQHTGTPDHMVCPADSPNQGSDYTSPMRQHGSDSSSEERQLPSFSPFFSSRTDLETGDSIQLDSHNIAYRRQVQYPRGSTVQEHNTVIRMVNTSSDIQKDSPTQSSSRSRSVRHTSQQSAADLRCSLPGSRGSSNRCPIDSMGNMESSVPLSSNSIDIEDFGETRSYTVHQCHSGHTRGTNKTLVYGTSIAQSSFSPIRRTTHTDCGEQDRNSSPTYQTSRVEVIKCAYSARFPHSHRVVDLLANPIRKSSQGDYERKWHYFCAFLRERDIPPNAITLDCVLDFLVYLFFDKGLQASTIAHYRSALTVPLKLQYKVDLNDYSVTTLLKAMLLQRPKAPTAAPAWCLNKVLTFIDNLPTESTVESSLQKCAFLLLLATGWRISELHACVRDTAYCRFLDDSTLLIRPHPSFLAKNESTEKRWQHEKIKPLLLHDGSSSHLCPVRSLQSYLSATSSTKSGCLFLNHKTGKPLSIKQLSLAICRLIGQADPETKAKVHDIRKYAASCALSETMQASSMINALHWRSPHTFWKHYMHTTSPLSTAAVLPGTSVSPGSAPDSTHHS